MKGTNIIAAAVVLIAAAPSWTQEADALRLYRSGQYSQAVEICLEELRDRGPDQLNLRMDSYTVLGWSLLGLRNYDQALSYARQARGEVRYDIRIIEIEGEALFFLGRNTEALALFEEYISLTENFTGDRVDVVYYYMGEIFLRLAEYRHADIAISTALHHSPQTARWWARLGYAREQIPELGPAEAAYARALELDPSLEDARIGLERIQG